MKITLIGSSRFLQRYEDVNLRLSLAGHVVYSIATVSTSIYKPVEGELAPLPVLNADQKETLDLVHLRKIQESDAVYLITDETGYVGESTKRELKWASMNGVDVYVGNHALEFHLLHEAAGDFEEKLKGMQEAVRRDAARGSYDCTKAEGNVLGGLGKLFQNAGGPDVMVVMGRAPQNAAPKAEDSPN